MTEKLTTFDPAEGLTSDVAIAAFMADALDSGDAGYIAHALGIAARAKGMTQIRANSCTAHSASVAIQHFKPHWL